MLVIAQTYPLIDVWMMSMFPLILVQFSKEPMFVALIDRV